MIHTMLAGHIVDAEIVEQNPPKFGIISFTCKFICHHDTKKKRLCLDLGLNWFITKGEEFITHQINIDRAEKLIKGESAIVQPTVRTR